MSTKEECLRNVKSVANLDLCQKISDFANKKLGHIWHFTPDEVLKIMQALTSYCINCGEKSNDKDLESIMLRRLEWTQGDSGIRVDTWAC